MCGGGGDTKGKSLLDAESARAHRPPPRSAPRPRTDRRPSVRVQEPFQGQGHGRRRSVRGEVQHCRPGATIAFSPAGRRARSGPSRRARAHTHAHAHTHTHTPRMATVGRRGPVTNNTHTHTRRHRHTDAHARTRDPCVRGESARRTPGRHHRPQHALTFIPGPPAVAARRARSDGIIRNDYGHEVHASIK